MNGYQNVWYNINIVRCVSNCVELILTTDFNSKNHYQVNTKSTYKS